MKSRPSKKKGYGGPNNRDPLLDTGVPGVIVSRAIKKGQKRVVVSAAFQMGQPGGKPKPVMRYVGSLFEGALEADSIDAHRRFSGFLRKAMAIRRYAESFYERGEYPSSRLRYDDVPGSIVEMVPEPPVMDLRAIMDSFQSCHASGESGRDLDSLALTLQGYTLERRRPSIVFNGHRLTFHSLMADGVRFFVPEQMGRGRDHWWLTVDAEDGQIFDEIYDADHGEDCQTSLREAWLYLVSLLRAHAACQRR